MTEVDKDYPVGNLMESKISQLDDLLNDKLERIFNHYTLQISVSEIIKIASEYSPVDLAHVVDRIPVNARLLLYENLPSKDDKVEFIISLEGPTRQSILRKLAIEEIKGLVQLMPVDEAVWILDEIPPAKSKAILSEIDQDIAKDIKEVQKHNKLSAAWLMSEEFFQFSKDTTIGEVAKVIRNNPGIDFTRAVFVSNELGELIGYVTDRAIIVNNTSMTLSQIMRPIEHTVFAGSSREEVIDLIERYKLPVLPVISEENKMEGVITYEDVVEALEDISPLSVIV